jgi:uncharacterized protein YjbI with pentapeptide repeats
MDACNLLGAAFPRSGFSRAFGRNVVRAAATLTDCNFDLADLAAIRLPGCDISRSRFREADLSRADLEGAQMQGADLFGAIVDEARLAGADLRGAEVSGLDIRRLATYQDLKITPDQQYRLLDALGIDVQSD